MTYVYTIYLQPQQQQAQISGADALLAGTRRDSTFAGCTTILPAAVICLLHCVLQRSNRGCLSEGIILQQSL
jgi:hypothetical protein